MDDIPSSGLLQQSVTTPPVPVGMESGLSVPPDLPPVVSASPPEPPMFSLGSSLFPG
jgi:hypothetical protein